MEINKDTPVEEIVREKPSSIEIFRKFGIEVIICGEVVWDSLGELCEKHNVNPEILINEILKLDK